MCNRRTFYYYQNIITNTIVVYYSIYTITACAFIPVSPCQSSFSDTEAGLVTSSKAVALPVAELMKDMEAGRECVAVKSRLTPVPDLQTRGLVNVDPEASDDDQLHLAPSPITGCGKFMYVDLSLVGSQPMADSDTELEAQPELHTTAQTDSDLGNRTGSRTGRTSLLERSPLPEDLSTAKMGFVTKTEPALSKSSSKTEAETLAASIVTAVSGVGMPNSHKERRKIHKVKAKPEGQAQRLPCAVCGASFLHQGDLKRHTRIHTGERPFACSACGATFNRSDHLKYHMTKHTGVRPLAKQFVCGECDTTFTRKNDMKRHILRKHSLGEPFPFICSECDARFVTVSELKKHKRIHTGEKPFSCSLCSAAFNQSSHLKSHMTKHTGEKPYPCERCGAAFRWSSLLKNHIAKAHL